MNITLRQLTYFNALAQQRNFGRAAEICHVSQPALSQQIKELEAQLGAPLVERKARDVVLTPFGRTILDHARAVLRESQALMESARWQGGLRGQLRLGVIPTIAPYVLPDALAALRASDINLDVEVQEAKTDRLIAGLHSGALDVALMALPSGAAGLTETPLFDDAFLLAGTAAGLDRMGAARDALRPTELGRSKLLLLEDGHCLTDQALEVCGRGRGHAQINMGASSLATLVRLVAAGFGLTLLPELAAATELRATPDLQLLRFSDPQPLRRIGLVRRATTQSGAWFDDLAQILTAAGQAQITATQAIAQ